MDRWKAEMGRASQEKRRRKRKSQKKEDPGALKGRKVAKHCVSSLEGRKVGSRRRRVQSPLGRREMKNCTQSKCTKHLPKKCTPLWREAHFEVKMYKTHQVRNVQMSFCVAGARDCAPCQKWANRVGSVACPKKVADVDIWRGSAKMHFLRQAQYKRHVHQSCYVRRSGRWFPERGCILENQIFRFAEVILRDRCSTSYDLASLFSWQAQYFRQVEWNNRKTHWYEAVSSALNFPFLKEVSQNCFVFDGVNFENWGSLADLFPFWCCQVQKPRTSRRIASFSSLQIDR